MERVRRTVSHRQRICGGGGAGGEGRRSGRQRRWRRGGGSAESVYAKGGDAEDLHALRLNTIPASFWSHVWWRCAGQLCLLARLAYQDTGSVNQATSQAQAFVMDYF
eukprot:2820750-Pleurochrysis_carterae.AAC.1